MLEQAVKGNLDKCMKCGICVANCPVANNTSKFSGPKHMGPELTRFRLDENITLEEQVDYCCNCRSCEIACPSGVKVSLLNAFYKSHLKSQQQKINFRDNLLGRPGILAQLGSINTGITNFMLKKDLMKYSLDRILGISKHSSFPPYQKENFIKWFGRRPKFSSSKKVVYFVGCSTNYNSPEIGKSVVQVLEHNGYEVIVPHQGCCGLPLIANGYLDAAKSQGTDNLTSFMPYVDKGYPVIVNCTSCSLTLKSEYHEMMNLSGATKLAGAVYDFSEFLRHLKQKGQLNTDFKPMPLKLAYHNPCHLKAQGIGEPSLELLQLIPQLNVFEIDQGCCGLSGSYGFKKEKYQISMHIGQKLFDTVAQINPDYVTTDCNGCAMQLLHGTGKKTIHPAVILAKAIEKV